MKVDKEEVFLYLDGLRESGATNMFGATDYLKADFGLEEEEARTLLKEWMKTFVIRHKGEYDEIK